MLSSKKVPLFQKYPNEHGENKILTTKYTNTLNTIIFLNRYLQWN